MFVAGVGIARWFERRGYSIGKTQEAPLAVGLAGPATLAALLVLFLAGDVLAGPGPGAVDGPAHAMWWQALALALAAGAILTSTGFCAVSAARQVFGGPRAMLVAAAVFVAAYAAVNAAVGPPASGAATVPPVSHGDALWNVLAMVLVGLCGAFAGGCPVRQIVMAGEGNGDAFVAVGGMVLGGALAHTLGIASQAAKADAAGGSTPAGRPAVGTLIAVVVAYAAAVTASARARTANPTS